MIISFCKKLKDESKETTEIMVLFCSKLHVDIYLHVQEQLKYIHN